jgi:ornithine--oxo-acid transaminase
MLQSHVPPLAGELAERLSTLAGGDLTRTVFTSTGSEGVETAIKFARAFTRRPGILHARGAFHGLTCGALSLMGNPWWRNDFEPLLPEVDSSTSPRWTRRCPAGRSPRSSWSRSRARAA